MEVNDQKNICLGISRINDSRVLQKLATLNVFISDSSAITKLCLFEKHSDEIHILLGSDIVGKLFTGEVKQLSEGLTAVNTRLGWTLMGKINNESKFKSENSLLVHSLLTNREKISDLWELDSLGITDTSEKRSKLELQDLALKHLRIRYCETMRGQPTGIWPTRNTNYVEHERRYLSISYRETDIERKFEAWKKQLMERYKTSRFPEDYRISILKMRTYANEGSHLPINIDPELSKHQGAATPLTQPCSSVSNGGARLEPRAENKFTSAGQRPLPCSPVPVFLMVEVD
ncbi:integrase catalytic domain-containing protein [Trichonephila clavata]|uniref:Integrase catalytic domain-containing protein n=1 Tax=Trichonephila clavata TaxID=2740835 RepID=A0A8X6LKH1_TRICU|nr:integrase catalytic domain-containing protein [Trichonephila clavata]